MMGSNLTRVLNYLYLNEVNCCVESFFSGGWTFKIGDQVNGYKATAFFDDLDQGADWLLHWIEENRIDRRNDGI